LLAIQVTTATLLRVAKVDQFQPATAAALPNSTSENLYVFSTWKRQNFNYDYLAYYTPLWPNGVDQRAALVGTIVRAAPHSDGQAEAGFVASMIAVRQ